MRFMRAGWLALVLLAGCSGPIETRVAVVGALPPAGPGATFAIAKPPVIASEDPLLASARAAVADRLVARGFALDPSPRWIVSVALSQRPANIAVKSGEGKWQQPAKRQRLLQNCLDHDDRLTVQFLDAATGAVVHSVDADETHCHAPLASVVPKLAEIALAGGGSRSVSRSGTD